VNSGSARGGLPSLVPPSSSPGRRVVPRRYGWVTNLRPCQLVLVLGRELMNKQQLFAWTVVALLTFIAGFLFSLSLFEALWGSLSS
jgi:hypothetical protein